MKEKIVKGKMLKQKLDYRGRRRRKSGIGKYDRMIFVQGFFIALRSVHTKTVVHEPSRIEELPTSSKNYLLTYGLSPRLAYLPFLFYPSLSLSVCLSFPSLLDSLGPAARSHNHKEYNGWKPLAAFHCHFFSPPINFRGADLVLEEGHSRAADG